MRRSEDEEVDSTAILIEVSLSNHVHVRSLPDCVHTGMLVARQPGEGTV
jgi:hypothetical protein